GSLEHLEALRRLVAHVGRQVNRVTAAQLRQLAIRDLACNAPEHAVGPARSGQEPEAEVLEAVILSEALERAEVQQRSRIVTTECCSMMKHPRLAIDAQAGYVTDELSLVAQYHGVEVLRGP